MNGGQLESLPTRDAFIAILGALVSAVSRGQQVSELFAALPQRFTQAGLIDNFPVDVSKELKLRFAGDDAILEKNWRSIFRKSEALAQLLLSTH